MNQALSSGPACAVKWDHAEESLRLLVHGGAWAIPAACGEEHRAGVQRAYLRGLELYRQKAEPLDIVCGVLEILEDDPAFDAGYGSFLNAEGQVELDAAVVTGADLQAGCVSAVRGFRHPSQIARFVHYDPDLVFLSGEGAQRYAWERGLCSVPDEDLVHTREKLSHAAWLKAGCPPAQSYFKPYPSDTVGVVVGVATGAHKSFSLAAGLSTGGTPGKRPGRVGDTPVLGAGLLADDESVAVACTGWGEGLLRLQAASRVQMFVRQGEPLHSALKKTLMELHARLGGYGGLMAITPDGEMAAACSTPDMAFCGAVNVCQLTFP